MVTEGLARWLLGNVRLTGTGGMPERFLNLAAHAGIRLWGMRKRDGVLSAYVNIRSYRALRPLARKCGMRMRISRKTGLPFFVPMQEPKRVVCWSGAFAVIYYVLSMYVWTVDVHGNTTLDTADVLAAAEERGLMSGA